MRARFVVVSLLVSAMVVAGVNLCRAQSSDPRVAFANSLIPGMNLQGFTQQLQSYFRGVDFNMDGVVSQADADLQAADWPRAIWRPRLVELIGHDLNFDGVITYEEVVRSLGFRIRRQAYIAPSGQNSEEFLRNRIDEAVAGVMRADTNGDGQIDWEEMLAFARQALVPPNSAGNAMAGVLAVVRSMDADGDGVVTVAEFNAALERVFREADADNDGIISKEETVGFRARVTAEAQAEFKRRMEEGVRQREAARQAACTMPAPSPAARVVLLRVPPGDALSTVTIASQDVTVDTGQIVIEPGDEPLYLIVLGSNTTIWRFTGAVERMERLVLAGTMTGPNSSNREQRPIIGAVGIPAERVAFLGRPGCIPTFHEMPSELGTDATEAVRRVTGMVPRLMVVAGPVAELAVPSGKTTRSDTKPTEFVVREDSGTVRIERGSKPIPHDPVNLHYALQRFHAGGVVDIDPQAVVASHPVERYKILPQEAGLLQLVHSGVLMKRDSGTQARSMEFMVQRATRFPPGLYGAHQVKFVVAKGVPVPEGDPGHSCVVMEATGQAVANAPHCRSD